MYQDNNDKYYEYLLYVTLREVFEACNAAFWSWAYLTGFFAVLDYLFTETEAYINSTEIIPKWAWSAIIISAMMWIWKDKEIKFKLPNITFKSWIWYSILLFVTSAIFANTPWWICISFYFAFMTLCLVIDKLVIIGSKNYERLKSAPPENKEYNH